MGNRDYQRGGRHADPQRSRRTSASRQAGERRDNPSRPRREALRDSYYYEEPPRSWREGDQFQDISSYSSPQKRREDQRALEEERRRTRRSAPQPRQAPQRKKSGVGKKVAAVLLALVVLAVAWGAWVASALFSGLTMTALPSDPASLGIQEGATRDSKVVNIALFGLDARENETTGRSDAVMVLTVDNRRHKLKVTSILRDSEVYIEGYGYDKITHAYAYGGPELAVKTLNQNFNLDIENYVTVNFIQMAEIVDAFGGVKINVTDAEMVEINNNLAMQILESNDANIQDSDYLHQSGDVLLNGNQAVAYARIRHLDSDDVRASRQQEVILALVDRLKTRNPLQYPSLIHKVTSMCETSLQPGDMLGLVPALLPGLQMETLSIPGEEENAYGAFLDSGAWVYEYDLGAASQHISRFIYEEDSPYYTGEG